MLATVSSNEIEAAKKPTVVKNTEIYCVSCLCVHVMAEERNKRSNQKYPIEVLFTSDTTELCHWLCMFMKEARCDDG